MDAVEIVRSPAANLPIDDAVTDRRSLSLGTQSKKIAMPTPKFAISYVERVNEYLLTRNAWES